MEARQSQSAIYTSAGQDVNLHGDTMSLSQTSTALVGTIDTYELRLELKAWEHDFLAANGRKPAKGDIKANQEMGQLLPSLYATVADDRQLRSTSSTTSLHGA